VYLRRVTRYRILCDGEIIGSSDLDDRDASLGTAGGRFVPTAAYERVRPVFQLFIAARADGESEADVAKLEAYETARAQLALTLTDAAGKELATSGIAVLDFAAELGPGASAEERADAIEVEVYFVSPRQFAQLG
jgi:hypothetical protein